MSNIYTDGIEDEFWGMWMTNREDAFEMAVKKSEELKKAGYDFRLLYASDIDGKPRAEIFVKRTDLFDNDKYIRFLEQ